MFQPRLRRVPVVSLQQATQALAALDRAIPRRRCVRFRRPTVVQPLVRALQVVMLDVLLDDVPNLALAEENDLVQALSLGGSYPRLAEGIQVRTPRGIFRQRTPATRSVSWNFLVKSGSRSWIRIRLESGSLP